MGSTCSRNDDSTITVAGNGNESESNNVAPMSNFDLVPLFQVLKDCTILDLNKAMEDLRQHEQEKRLLVKVTGPGGTPVYGQGSLKDGKNAADGDMWHGLFDYGDMWHVLFDYENITVIERADPINTQFEFHLGGVVVGRSIQRMIEFADVETAMLHIHSGVDCPIFLVAARCMINIPFTHAELEELQSVTGMDLDNFMTGRGENCVGNLMISSVFFKKSHISDLLAPLS